MLAAGEARAASESVVYSFMNGADGCFPDAGLIYVGGALFGTAEAGGRGQVGTVFKVTLTGGENVLHYFAGAPDGSEPHAGLLNFGGTLYGTTLGSGDANGEGTVFKVTKAGKEDVVYSFKAAPDGARPVASLISVGGTLYGTTEGGGNSAYGYGTVFKVTPAGVEHVLHSFSSGTRPDGGFPQAGLLYVGGNLYGTTMTGGKAGGGTVFKVTPAGVESILHSFGSGSDGIEPLASLTYLGGALYGTTSSGGVRNTGTVFKITLLGDETVIYSFGSHSLDGGHPVGSLISFLGNLYGTTELGGAKGNGTVFKVTPAGGESVLYSFNGYPDGNSPVSNLVEVGGVFYGTTNSGGVDGCGTVFKVTP
jgi:uncharacterized repeat protein (TIGR03803 family)